MTAKRVEYDPKAVEKMRRRGLTRQDVRWLLAEGVPTPADTPQRGDQRFAKRGYIRGREAAVIYLENAERVYVISPHWIYSKGAHAREQKRRKGGK